MAQALTPPDDEGRLAAVRRHDIVGTPPDGTFDRITALAAQLFDVPVAIVSVVDEDRIWFKSHHGLDVEQVDRDPGLCASAILQYEPYILTDATLDPTALTNPLVAGSFGLRFYAAAPLTTRDGHNLGTLCVLDVEPRKVTDRERVALTQLAGLVVHELELRLAAKEAVHHEETRRNDAVAGKRAADELAEALQSALLPPALPRIPGVEVAARYRPADRAQVGGDFYDLFPLPGQAWGVVMGDVCGKGPHAASLTTAARYALRAAAIEHDRPREVLHMLNEALLTGNNSDDDDRFCTLAYARLRPRGAEFKVEVASGGHPAPYLLSNDGRVEAVGGRGMLVGSLPEATFTDDRIRLRTGDSIVFVTDGVTEAVVGEGELGTDGVADVLRSCAGLPAATIVDNIEQASVDPRRPQRDDVTILVLRLVGTPD